MSDSNFPDPSQRPYIEADYYEEPKKPNILRPLIAIILVIVLVSGSALTAFGPFILDFLGPDQFDAVITGISSTTTGCSNAPQVTPEGRIEATNRICICGRIFTEDGDDTVNYYLSLRDNENDMVERQRFADQRSGQFCHVIEVDDRLRRGRYLIEISPSVQSDPVQWKRFNVYTTNRSAMIN